MKLIFLEYVMIEKPLKKANIVCPLTILFTILMVFSGCARNLPPSAKLSSAEIPEKQVKLIKKAEMQLDHFSNECIPVVDQCVEKKQEMIYLIDFIEDTVSKINIDSSSMEMDDFLYTVSYLRDEIKNLGHFSDSIRETKDRVEDLKNELHELQANIDEIYLVAEDESERENTNFSLKKKITHFMVQRKFGMHTKNTFGL